MINSIINAVTTQLGKTFGLGYRYYFENVEQNLTTPCFTIDVILPTERSKSQKKYDRSMPLVIHYFSDSKSELKKDCYEKAEQILECVEYIPYKNTILRGENISWQIVDNRVLQVFVTYSFETIMSKETEENMGEILDSIVRTN